MFSRQGRRPHLSVTIGLSTLAGLDNLPGTLAGFGAIPAGLARSIAASAATINALITDPDTGRSPRRGPHLPTHPGTPRPDRRPAQRLPIPVLPTTRLALRHRPPGTVQPPTPRTRRQNHRQKTPALLQAAPFDQAPLRLANPDRPEPHRARIHQPHRPQIPKQGRQAAAPGLWVSTAGTAIAERLDLITSPPSTLIRRDDDEPAPTSHIEDLLAAILVRHHLNTKTIEIDYDQPATGWQIVDQKNRRRSDRISITESTTARTIASQPPWPIWATR